MTDAKLVHDFLLQSAERRAQDVAVIHKQNCATYGELLRDALAVGGWLAQQGLQPGERVVLLVSDPFVYIAGYFGVLMAGGVVVPLNTQTTARSLGTVLNDCGVSVVIAERKCIAYLQELGNAVPTLRAVVVAGDAAESFNGASFEAVSWAEVVQTPAGGIADRDESDYAQIIYTSGTTGEPKGITLSHRNLVSNTASIVEYLGLQASDRVMDVLPFFYSYGNSVLLTHMAVGGSLVVNHSFVFPNVVLEDMAKHRVTGFSGVPSTFAILLHRSAIRDYTFPHLRYLTQAGGPMAPQLVDELLEICPTAKLYVMYGQTEASARLSYLPPEDIRRKTGSIGRAIPGVVLEVVDRSGEPTAPGETGEIVASGPNVMCGYWGQPERTREVLRDGRLWTGDLARVDDEGYLFIVGRKKEMIKSGAHRIAPKEIEEVLLAHAAVHEAAVIGAPDAILGEAIVACVVLNPGCPCDQKELLAHCSSNLPTFKVPKEVRLLDNLPKTQSGKIRKAALSTCQPQPVEAHLSEV